MTVMVILRCHSELHVGPSIAQVRLASSQVGSRVRQFGGRVRQFHVASQRGLVPQAVRTSIINQGKAVAAEKLEYKSCCILQDEEIAGPPPPSWFADEHSRIHHI